MEFYGLAILYILSLVTFGFCSSCIPCCYLRDRRLRVRLVNKWVLSTLLVVASWTVAGVLWIAYSPLSTCGARAVYSYPHEASHTTWRPFWCARRCDASTLVYPRDVAHLQSLVRNATRVRAVGGGHSSTELQCADGGVMLAIHDNFCEYGGIDEHNVTTLGAGCTVDQSLRWLMRDGMQLNGFGGITEQRIGGAVSTSLHGQHPVSFTQHIVGITAVVPNGSVVDMQVGDPDFWAWPGSMGRLGVIVSVRMQAWPIQYVDCHSAEGNESAFDAALRAPTAGFEAKRLLASDQYLVRTCRQVASPSTTLAYEDKDNLLQSFAIDNGGVAALMLLGELVRRAGWFANLMFNLNQVASSRAGVVAAVNDYRVAVSFNPHFDEEYAVPTDSCHAFLDRVRDTFPGLQVHASIRRVAADPAWLSWAPVDSCCVRLEYYSYASANFIEFERRFRMEVEQLVLDAGGSGHRGKLWYRHAQTLVQNTPRAAQFEAYRRALDPSDKFENRFTAELTNSDERFYRTLPVALQTRAFVWRVFIWIAVAINVLVAACLCRMRGRRIVVEDTRRRVWHGIWRAK